MYPIQNVTLLFGLGWTLIKDIVVPVNVIENSQVFNYEFSVLSIVQNGKLGVGKPLTLIIMHKRKTPRFSTPPSFPV